MDTINISLPAKLKSQANSLVKRGFYASFSDLVRDSVRKAIERNKFDLWAEEAKQDLKTGKAAVLKSDKEIEKFVESL